VIFIGIAAVCVGAGALWVKMPPLGYDWAPQAIIDWQRIRTAEALVRREIRNPDSAEFQNMRISDKTFFGIRKQGLDADEENFFAICGEVKSRSAPGGSKAVKKVVVHFDIRGGRGHAVIEPDESDMAAMAPYFEDAMRPCR
jgi:hypothetical protein